MEWSREKGIKREIAMTKIEMFQEHIKCAIKDDVFREKLTGPNAHDQARWMMEARGDLQRCVDKLGKVLEVEG